MQKSKENHRANLFKIISEDQEILKGIKEEVEDYRWELLEEVYEKMDQKAKEVFDAKLRIFKKQVVKDILDGLEEEYPAPDYDDLELTYDEFKQEEALLKNNKKHEDDKEDDFKLEMA